MSKNGNVKNRTVRLSSYGRAALESHSEKNIRTFWSNVFDMRSHRTAITRVYCFSCLLHSRRNYAHEKSNGRSRDVFNISARYGAVLRNNTAPGAVGSTRTDGKKNLTLMPCALFLFFIFVPHPAYCDCALNVLKC